MADEYMMNVKLRPAPTRVNAILGYPWGGGGGEGTHNIYWWGCAAAHPTRGGVLGTGTTQKRGVLCTVTTQKGGS